MTHLMVMLYWQSERETCAAFMYRIYFTFTADLGPNYKRWPDPTKKNMVDKFIQGVTKADWSISAFNKSPKFLLSLSFDALMAHLQKADKQMGSCSA